MLCLSLGVAYFPLHKRRVLLPHHAGGDDGYCSYRDNGSMACGTLDSWRDVVCMVVNYVDQKNALCCVSARNVAYSVANMNSVRMMRINAAMKWLSNSPS